MKRLACLVFLVLILLPIYGQQEIKLEDLLMQLRQEINFTESCLIVINEQLMNTKTALGEAENERMLMQQNYENMQKALNDRIEALEMESLRISKEKKLLQQEYERLKESEGLPQELRKAFDNYSKKAETAIKAWRTAAIVVPAVLVTIYLVKTLTQPK